jgi:hypothetical protein
MSRDNYYKGNNILKIKHYLLLMKMFSFLSSLAHTLPLPHPAVLYCRRISQYYHPHQRRRRRS